MMDKVQVANLILWGMLVMACAAAGLFFLRFWRKTRDRLFAIFAVAFWALGLNWLLIACMRADEQDEVHFSLYLVRLFAFLLILFAIVDKNRASRRRPSNS